MQREHHALTGSPGIRGWITRIDNIVDPHAPCPLAALVKADRVVVRQAGRSGLQADLEPRVLHGAIRFPAPEGVADGLVRGNHIRRVEHVPAAHLLQDLANESGGRIQRTVNRIARAEVVLVADHALNPHGLLTGLRIAEIESGEGGVRGRS